MLFIALIVMGSTVFAQHCQLALTNNAGTGVGSTTLTIEPPTGSNTSGCGGLTGTFYPTSPIVLSELGNWTGYADGASFTWSGGAPHSGFTWSSAVVYIGYGSCATTPITISRSACGTVEYSSILCSGGPAGTQYFDLKWNDASGGATEGSQIILQGGY